MLNWINKKIALQILFVFIVLTNISFWILVKTPAKVDLACVQGGSFTLLNSLLAVLLSLLLSFNFVGIIKLLADRGKKSNATMASLGGISFVLWILSTVCFVCYAPIIGIVGLSSFVGLLGFFEGWSVILSIVLAIIGIFLIDRQIRFGCINPDNCEI